MNDPCSETTELYLKPVEPFQVEPLLNSSFPVPEGRSFFDDFPAWVTERALWMGLYREGDVLQAAAGALPAQWSLGTDESPVSIVRIGGVVTQESARGQGLASQLVDELVHLARGAGAQGVVLWGQDSPLYRRLEFAPLGRQLRVPLSQLNFSNDRKPAFLHLEEGFSEDIFQGMTRNRQRYGGVLLSQGELEEIRDHKSIHWARVLNSNRELVGYGGFGKGIDLGRQLHEWGGADDAIQVLARWALSLDSEAEIMGTQMLLESLFGELPPETLVEPLCLAKIFDPDLEAYLRSREGHLWFWGMDGV